MIQNINLNYVIFCAIMKLDRNIVNGQYKRGGSKMTLRLLKKEMRLGFRKWEDFLEFQKRVEEVLSKDAWENCTISPYPKKFIWFPMIYLETEEIGKIIEIAYEVVNK